MTFLRKNLLRANPFASSRSSLTCQYKCGNASVGGGAALAACATGAENENGADSKTGDSASGGKTTASESATDQPSADGMHFDSVEPNEKDEVVVPAGYEQSVLIAWGDPVVKGAPEFDVHNQKAADAEKQFGFNNDFAGLLEHPSDDSRLIYVCNHEYTTEPQMFPGYDSDNRPTSRSVWAGPTTA